MKTIKIAAIAVFALACGAFCFSKSAEMLNNPYVDMEAFADGDENLSTQTPPDDGHSHASDLEWDTDPIGHGYYFFKCIDGTGTCTEERAMARNELVAEIAKSNGGKSTSVSGSVSAFGATVSGSYSNK